MNFKYQALNAAGKVETGTIESEAETAARQVIRGRGLYLVSLKAMDRQADRRKIFLQFGIKQKLPIQLARQLASLLHGGVPLFQALSIIANQMEGERAKEIVGFLRDQVRGGSSLSEALKAYPRIFDNLFVYCVQAGERTGALDSIFVYLADLLENRAVIRGRIRTALVYPAIMSVVGTGVLLFLIGYVVPMVIKIFERLNQKLPLATQILISITSFVNTYLIYFLAAAALTVFLLLRWVRQSSKARGLRDRFLLHAPLFGTLYQMTLVSRFARILHTLLKSGVHMLQSLMVVSWTMKNTIVADALRQVAEMVERGSDLSAALRETAIFPGYVTDMVQVGESSGNLEGMLETVSNYYDTQANQRVAAFTAMIEPLIIVVLGAVIAFILVSILLPLFEMNKVLTRG